MTGMKYTYDEEGMTFYFFLFTLVALYAIPTTWRLIFPNSSGKCLHKHIHSIHSSFCFVVESSALKDKVNCTCEECKKNAGRRAILKAAYKSKFGWIK
jgi:preprotein translocase subunit Sec63